MTQHKQFMVAVNLTGSDMTDVDVVHSGGGEKTKLDVPALAHGSASGPKVLFAESGHTDTWTISATIGTKTVEVKDKKCNLPNGGGTTAIVFHASTVTFATPDNSPCSSEYD